MQEEKVSESEIGTTLRSIHSFSFPVERGPDIGLGASMAPTFTVWIGQVT